jgi:limonene-1,2-epoxide hydrolase
MICPVERYAQFMGRLSKETLPEITQHVASNVFFRDPFNEVVGVEKMRQIFEHMYETMGEVRFDIQHQAMDGATGLLHWRIVATLRGKPWEFEGMTKAEFNEDGLVVSHVDHWDAAREFYEHFPIIGWSLKAIRRKIAL